MSKQSDTPQEKKPEKRFTQESAHILLRAAVFLIIAQQALITFLKPESSANLPFFITIASAWLAVSLFIRRGVTHHNWAHNAAQILLSSMDAYFIMACISLSAGASSLAIRVYGLYCFALVFAAGPLNAMAAFAAGVVAYISVYTMQHPGKIAPVWIAAITGLAGVICGMAWRIVAPILWRALKLLIRVYQTGSVVMHKGTFASLLSGNIGAEQIDKSLEDAVAQDETDPDDEEEPDEAVVAEELKLALAEKEEEIENLKKQKETLSRELEKAISEGFGPKTKSAKKDPDTDKPEQATDAPEQAAYESGEKLIQENEALKKEIEDLKKELDETATALFEQTVAGSGGKKEEPEPAGNDDKNLAERVKDLEESLKKTEEERDNLKTELEKTNDELMKLFENADST